MSGQGLKNLENYLQLGWYHLAVLLLYQLCILGNLVNMAFMLFGGAKPKLNCPAVANEPVFESPELCALVKNGTCSVKNMTYDFYSINAEWELVCENSNLVYMATSVQMFGVLVGAPLFGQLSDTFGRKWVLCASWVCVQVAGIASAFSPTWTVFTVCRFFIGLFMAGVITVWYVFSTEIIPHRHRVWIFAVGGWSPAYVAFAWLAYLCQNWRALSWAGNLITAPALIIVAIFLFESPRWLLYHGKIDEAAKVITKINSWTRRQVDQEELAQVLHEAVADTEEKKATKHSFWHLFYTWKLARYTLTLAFLWFTTSWVSYGLMFNAGNLSGSIYLNVTYYGSMRWAICLIMSVLDVSLKLFGRKLAHSISVGLMIISCAIILVFMLTGLNESYIDFVRYLNLFAAVLVSPVWLIVYLLSAELYPTQIRNLANSFGSLFARIGGVLAPQVLYLSDHWPPAIYVIFIIFLTIDWLAYLVILPETKGKPLPEKMPEKWEKIGRKISLKRLSITRSSAEAKAPPSENCTSV